MKNRAVIDRLEAAMAALAPLDPRAMIGGLCFFKHGNMICGVHAGGAMFRPGKVLEAEARAPPGTGPEFDRLPRLAQAGNARLKAT